MDIFQTKSYDMQWPQLEGWEDKGKDIIDFNLGFSDEVFAVECRKNIQQEPQKGNKSARKCQL